MASGLELVERMQEEIIHEVNHRGLQLQVLRPQEWHLQIRGGDFVVNYYPTSRKAYINGANHAVICKDASVLVDMALGDKKPVGIAKSERKRLDHHKRHLWVDSKRCWVCQSPILDYADASIEHKVPLSAGGSNRRDNLALSHIACNKNRGHHMKRTAGHDRSEEGI